MKVVVFGSRWPIPTPSPFCLTVLTWLRMAGIKHEVVISKGRPDSPTGKLPIAILDHGTRVHDSARIIQQMTEKHGVTLDAHRTPDQVAMMALVRSTLEGPLYFAGVLDRWGDGWHLTREAYFRGTMPGPVFALITPRIRKVALRQASAGLGKRSPDQVWGQVGENLDALVEVLGDDEHFFGSPGLTDARVYGLVENVLKCPFEGPMKQAVTARPSLVAHAERIRAEFWD